MNAHATALIADDEPLLRDALRRQLGIVWPELEIVAEARNGRDAVRLFDERHPDICFLDVHMPGLSGVDAANQIGRAINTEQLLQQLSEQLAKLQSGGGKSEALRWIRA